MSLPLEEVIAHLSIEPTKPEEPTTLFPKISGKHADFIANIQYKQENEPASRDIKTIELTGTVKLHGTHGDIVISQEDRVTFQSRNRTDLTPTSDNASFAKTLSPLTEKILALKDPIIQKWKELNGHVEKPENQVEDVEIIIAGEWIGPGIQKKVAISFLPSKLMVILAICINGVWQGNEDFAHIEDESVGIVNVARGGFYSRTLHVDDLDAGLKELQPLADAVELECPFGKAFGVTGPGEGIVWRPAGPSAAWLQSPKYWIKTKGPNGIHVPRVKLENKDGAEKTRLFAESVINDMRLQQGWDYMGEMNIPREMKTFPTYIKWLLTDIETEEKREIEEIGIQKQMLKKEVQNISKKWYFEKLHNPASE